MTPTRFRAVGVFVFKREASGRPAWGFFVSGREERAFLVRGSRHQFASLLQELRLLISKAQNKDRSRGGESDATYRAIVKMVGGKNYRAG
jgi:hypothetical protein